MPFYQRTIDYTPVLCRCVCRPAPHTPGDTAYTLVQVQQTRVFHCREQKRSFRGPEISSSSSHSTKSFGICFLLYSTQHSLGVSQSTSQFTAQGAHVLVLFQCQKNHSRTLTFSFQIAQYNNKNWKCHIFTVFQST